MIYLTAEQAQQIEEVLKDGAEFGSWPISKNCEEALATIRAARSREQGQQVPVAWVGEGGKLLSYKDVPMPENILVYAAPVRTKDLTSELQQKCSDWGTYWRAPDSHGVNLSIEQAIELLRDALCVEVEIAPHVRTKDLTDDEIDAIPEFQYRPFYDAMSSKEWYRNLARAAIAADREKNRG